MSTCASEDFVDAIRRIVGEEHVSIPAGMLPNVSGIERSVQTVVRPSSADEIAAIVGVARRFRSPLYPVSRGMNWGYGSALPVTAGCALLDLGRMDQIRNLGAIGESCPLAILEPGVSQGRLFEAIDKIGLFFNATGAGPETSIVGNTLDRGFGYHGLRPGDILGLEVVLGTGETVRTGFWGVKNSSASLRYPSGVGPALDGLFCQSNYGVVTAAAIRLHPKPPVHAAMMVALNEENDLPEFLDALAGLRRSGVFSTIMHIGNARRVRGTLGPVMFDSMDDSTAVEEKLRRVEEILDTLPYRAWSGVTAIQGTAAAIDDAFARATEALEGIAKVERLDADSLVGMNGDDSLQGTIAKKAKGELFDLTRGVPIESSLWAPFWALGMERPEQASEMDESDVGILFCAPVFPLDGMAVSEAVRMLESALGRFKFDPFITLNIANESSLLCITNIVFDRRDEKRVRDAHEAIAALYRTMIEAGHYPYRLGIQSMDLAQECMGESFGPASALKRVFDPDGIIAPGRYGME